MMQFMFIIDTFRLIAHAPPACMQVGDRYPKEVERRQKRLQALNEAFSSGANTEIDLQRLQQEANGLLNQIQEIQERRAKQVSINHPWSRSMRCAMLLDSIRSKIQATSKYCMTFLAHMVICHDIVYYHDL